MIEIGEGTTRTSCSSSTKQKNVTSCRRRKNLPQNAQALPWAVELMRTKTRIPWEKKNTLTPLVYVLNSSVKDKIQRHEKSS